MRSRPEPENDRRPQPDRPGLVGPRPYAPGPKTVPLKAGTALLRGFPGSPPQ